MDFPNLDDNENGDTITKKTYLKNKDYTATQTSQNKLEDDTKEEPLTSMSRRNELQHSVKGSVR